MKKLLALLLVAVMVFALAACGQSNPPAATQAPASADNAPASGGDAPSGGDSAPAANALKVGVFWYTFADTYLSSVRTALDAALNAKGITFQNYDGNASQATQNEQIQTALTDGYNLLVVNAVTAGSTDVANEIINMAGSVPVVFFNRAIEADGEEGAVLGGNDNICFIGTDAPEAGHLQGKMIGEYLLENYDTVDLNGDGVISYAMMKGDEANVEAIYRTQYGQEDADAILTAAGKPALSYFDPNNSSKYQVDLNGTWSNTAAQEYMQTNLAQYNDANGNMIELVICNNDNMAEGTIAALEAIGYNLEGGDKYIPVYGVDATDSAQELIRAGRMTGTVKQDAEGMANAVADVVDAIGAGSSVVDAVSTVAGAADILTIAEGFNNKIFVAYAPFTA